MQEVHSAFHYKAIHQRGREQSDNEFEQELYWRKGTTRLLIAIAFQSLLCHSESSTEGRQKLNGKFRLVMMMEVCEAKTVMKKLLRG
jgi:hypothetical protein